MQWTHIWPDLRLRTKGLIVVAFPAAATVAIACAAYLIESRISAADQAANRSLQIVEAVQLLKSNETETSAHIRAYFLTAEDPFEDEARRDIGRFDGLQQSLANLVSGNPSQTRDVLRLDAIHHARVEVIYDAAARFQARVLTREQLRDALRVKEAERLQMAGILDAMEAEQRAVHAAYLRHGDNLRTQLRAATAGCALLGVVGGVVISLLFASGITRRIGKLQRNVARLKSGEPLNLLPEGSDEIGVLSQGIAMAAQILGHHAAALENVLHGIAQADDCGRYVSFNKAYGELTGMTAIPAPATFLETVDARDRSKVDEAVGRAQRGGRAEVEARIVRRGGGSADVGMTFLPVSDVPGYYIFLRDIAQQKEAEGALVRAKDAAVAANRTKSEFLAKISHDIRTPLNAILGSADLLSRTPLDPNQAEHVAMFQRNSRTLLALINDFLDFSRVEAGMVRVENIPFRVWETIDQAVATFRETAFRKGVGLNVTLAPSLPEWQLGDPLRVLEVLVNLLSNALKFTDAGQVDLDVTADAGHLHFAVSDTGPGIPPDDQERIFAAFTQLPNHKPGVVRGSGLGLAICKELLDLMGGKIGVTSQLGHGSKFYFSLPLQAADPDRAEPDSGVAPPVLHWPRHRNGVRILVAEDTDDNRLLLAAYLRGEPVEVRFAVNGRQALDAIEEGEDFDLIVMDIDMPVMDGFQATKAIREWQRAHGAVPTPIVALSADAMREAVQASRDAGCVAHVAKPVDRNTLLSTILRYARSSRPAALACSADMAALVRGYLASKPAQIQDARECLAAGNFDPIRRFGHNLKGTGSGYGLPRIGEIGRELEKSAVERDAERITTNLEALHNAVTESDRDRVAAGPV
ncbi:MAG: ATP-binding protein [Bryobacteraceae bacterium]|jgi:PAS domain S-box-containing protein